MTFFKNFELLKPYQVEGADFALSNFYTLNRDRPGMGKSAQGLLAVCKYLDKYPNRRALVIAPQYLKLNWEDEIKFWTNLSYSLYTHKNSSILWDSDIVVISYDQLKMFTFSWKFTPLTTLPIKKCKEAKSRISGKIPWRSPKWSSICDLKFGFVIVDEAHNFKNYKAKRTINLVNFIDSLRPSFLLLLTGTPIKKKIQDLFIPLRLMAFGKRTENKITNKYKSYFLFCYRFTNVVKTKFSPLYKGVKNLEELKTYLVNRVIGRDPEKVLDLPPFNDVYVTVDYKENPELLEEYEKFNAGMEGKGAESSLKRQSALLKAPFTLEYAESLLEQDVGPVIIFTDHRDSLFHILEGLRSKGYKFEGIVGGEDTNIRKGYVNQLQAGELDGLVCTYGAGSEGLNMTASSHLILNDLHWVPEVISQARGRIRRITQMNRCTYHIIGGAVVDKKIWQSLKAAIKIIERVWEE